MCKYVFIMICKISFLAYWQFEHIYGNVVSDEAEAACWSDHWSQRACLLPFLPSHPLESTKYIRKLSCNLPIYQSALLPHLVWFGSSPSTMLACKHRFWLIRADEEGAFESGVVSVYFFHNWSKCSQRMHLSFSFLVFWWQQALWPLRNNAGETLLHAETSCSSTGSWNRSFRTQWNHQSSLHSAKRNLDHC